MRNISEKKVEEKTKTHILRSITFLLNLAMYEIMWQSTVEPRWLQRTIWRMRFAFWIPNATNTHPECEILIACPLQQWLHAGASISSYMYIDCLVHSAHRIYLCAVLLFCIVIKPNSDHFHVQHYAIPF
jgi:hypothetical protein